ncbi:TolC family outer membrane protein [Candidatus Aalborgicola defluviihabitans]|jgi:outer membrane protein|uniref:TolC family outer membrane protein n=1 Tax=Candidatus Aalborgicola defluviihabitans TaxID=3386187 RepID=UPI001E0DE39F|nr:TolC family outer membrane protein [Burkholderiales bacterium]MBK6569245.1 TolC family outer membrane protein [Burkholderiales bacterium]MBK7280671.1 TolC family outer membrane protein [Burkholderiales bacterium]MBK7314841.1 TolC family outer membrane protein [Burkholderiales bacterium]MBL0244053.1 TolC family outer membrane protein [Rhodoferax sp.]
MTRQSHFSNFRLLPLMLALGAALPLSVQAQSLIDLYTAARGYDTTYQAARSQFDATLAKADQAKAGILPQAGLALAGSSSNQAVLPTPARNYATQSATISASQPLYRPANWASYQQGEKSRELAQAQLQQAEQDLIVRVSQAYFDVLAANDSVTFVKSQKSAVAEQLASAKRNFEVGTSTITDSREAQARYDLVIAQELAAENDFLVKSLALNQLVGQPNVQPKPLKAPVVLAPVVPADVNQWVDQSQTKHPGIQQADVALEVAKLETQKAVAGHKPTLDLVGSYTAINNSDGSSTSVGDSRVNVGTVGLNLNIPLFAGFSVQNRVKETTALEEKARADLETAKRNVAQGTRTAYYGVQSGRAQVAALQAAEASSQSALEANQLGYQVGVRINIDVLNSQSQLFDTKAKLAKARYDVLVGELKLRQAAGTLTADDLQLINSQLAQ